MVEQKLLARRSEIDVHLQAGVLRDFPAVWAAAKRAVEGFSDGCVEKRALSFFCPDTKAEKRRCQSMARMGDKHRLQLRISIGDI